MSWDVAVLKIRGDFRPVAEVESEEFLPLGDVGAVRSAISSAFPSAEWSDPTWAVYMGPDFEIEFDLGCVESKDSLNLYVHGTGDPIPALLKFTGANGWVALDCSTGEFIDPKNPSYDGWEGFKALGGDIESGPSSW